MKLKLLILALLVSLGSHAQNIPLLDRVPGHRVVFDYTYSLEQKNVPMREVTSGQVVVEDNCFSLSGLGLEIRSDGENRWSVDREAKEVVIETVDDDDLVTNPALFISSYLKIRDRLKVNASSSDSLDVTLTLDDDTKARFVLKGIVFLEPTGEKKDFTFDGKSFGSDYLITDLR